MQERSRALFGIGKILYRHARIAPCSARGQNSKG